MYNKKALMERAAEAAKSAYCPYSGYHVGAALMSADGEIFTGCNVENASYGASCCAERTALFKAVSENKRGFSVLAIYAFSEKDEAALPLPCGICRQVFSEFCSDEFIIISANEREERSLTLGSLFPAGFTL